MKPQAPLTALADATILWDIGAEGTLFGVNPAGTTVAQVAAGRLARGIWRVQFRASSTFPAVLGAGCPVVRAALLGTASTKVFARQAVNDFCPFTIDVLAEVVDPAAEALMLNIDATSPAMGAGEYLYGFVCATFIGLR